MYGICLFSLKDVQDFSDVRILFFFYLKGVKNK